MVTKEWPTGSPALRNAIALIGQELLLHAGSGCGKHEFHNGVMDILLRSDPQIVISNLTVLDPKEDKWRVCNELPFGALVGSVKLKDIVWTDRRGHRYPYRGGAIPFGTPCLFCGERQGRVGPSACMKRSGGRQIDGTRHAHAAHFNRFATDERHITKGAFVTGVKCLDC